MKIKLIKKTFYQEEKTKERLAAYVRRSNFFSFNEQCLEFEKNFSQWQKRKYSVLFNSGSSANLALIQAMLNLERFKKADLIGVSSLTWSTNVMPLFQLGLKPVPIDCNLRTLNVSVEQLKKKRKIKCLFLTNVLGFSDDLQAIRRYCKENRIILLEDNCEALGTTCRGERLGNFGQAATFSFFVGHHLSAIEGGMVATNDKELSDMLRIVRSHGWDRHLDSATRMRLRKKHRVDNFYAPYFFYDLGYNLRPTEINGFLGNTQLEYLDETITRRYNNYLFWLRCVEKNDKLIKLYFPFLDFISNFAFPLIFNRKGDFKHCLRKFIKAGIEVRPIIAGDITRQLFYKKYSQEKDNCPNSSHIHECGFYFGNNPDLTKRELKYVANVLKEL